MISSFRLRPHPLRLLARDQAVDEGLDSAIQDLGDLVDSKRNPMVRDAAVRIVISTDLLRAVAASDLGSPRVRSLARLRVLLSFQQLGAKHSKRLLFVL